MWMSPLTIFGNSHNEKNNKKFFLLHWILSMESKTKVFFVEKVRWKFLFFTFSLMKISRQKKLYVYIQTYKHFAMRKHENLINCYSFWYGSLFSNMASSSCFGAVYGTLQDPQKWNLHNGSEQMKRERNKLKVSVKSIESLIRLTDIKDFIWVIQR